MAEAATAAAAGVTSGMDYKNPRIEKEPSGGPYHDDRITRTRSGCAW